MIVLLLLPFLVDKKLTEVAKIGQFKSCYGLEMEF